MAPFHSYIASAGAWTPADLVDGRLWLDASDSSTITLSGSSISLWEDKIGSNDATDAVNSSNVTITTKRPTIATSAQNGLDAIAVNGSRWFDHGSSAGLLRNRSCAIMAMAYKLGDLFQGVVWSNSGASNKYRFVYGTSFSLFGGSPVYAQAARLDADKVAQVQTSGFGSTAPRNTNWCVTVIVMDYAANSLSMRANGSVVQTTNFPTGGANTSDTDIDASVYNARTAIGASSRSGGTVMRNGGRIGELVCGAKSSGSYATSDIEEVEGYLAHKWGLASLLPSTHTYKDSAP